MTSIQHACGARLDGFLRINTPPHLAKELLNQMSKKDALSPQGLFVPRLHGKTTGSAHHNSSTAAVVAALLDWHDVGHNTLPLSAAYHHALTSQTKFSACEIPIPGRDHGFPKIWILLLSHRRSRRGSTCGRRLHRSDRRFVGTSRLSGQTSCWYTWF